MYNFILHFMSKRKIAVQINKQYSQTLPLHNWIPQGSPLSSILFNTGYNKLQHKNFEYIAYADDFNILIKHNKLKNPTINLNHIISDINKWSEKSGVKLSLPKCKYIHICRKRNCSCTVASNNISLVKAYNLKILGMTINNKYRWNNRIQNLNTSFQK